ncbi:MAG: antibiotic biosynthesis monooxygenase [Deltaproteobacteria bacterium]|nr:antibiotic biosynthesis monooxygenase [Deltaproteobacteria bacterium]
MKWAEMIKLRFTENDRDTVEQALAGFIGDVGRQDGLRKVHLYRHIAIAGDLCILLRWDSAEAAPQGSAVGLSLVHLLGEFGLTNHSVWIEGKTMKAPHHGGETGRQRKSGRGPRGRLQPSSSPTSGGNL